MVFTYFLNMSFMIPSCLCMITATLLSKNHHLCLHQLWMLCLQIAPCGTANSYAAVFRGSVMGSCWSQRISWRSNSLSSVDSPNCSVIFLKVNELESRLLRIGRIVVWLSHSFGVKFSEGWFWKHCHSLTTEGWFSNDQQYHDCD